MISEPQNLAPGPPTACLRPPSNSHALPASDVATSIIRNAKNPKLTSLDLKASGHAAAPDNHDEIVQGVSRTAIQKAKAPSIGKSTGLDLVKVAFQIKSAYTADAGNSRREEKRAEILSGRPVSHLSPVLPLLSLNPFEQWEIIPKELRKTRYDFPLPISLILS